MLWPWGLQGGRSEGICEESCTKSHQERTGVRGKWKALLCTFQLFERSHIHGHSTAASRSAQQFARALVHSLAAYHLWRCQSRCKKITTNLHQPESYRQSYLAIKMHFEILEMVKCRNLQGTQE